LQSITDIEKGDIMKLEFHGSSQPTLGVELELQVLDPNTLDLTAQSENLLNMCEKIGLERVKAEVHQSMLEIDTEIAQDVKKCKQLLTSRITQLNDVADIAGVRLAAGGTHPFQNWTDSPCWCSFW
jgi:glutamate---cysteine ligase / carboxylate-amine ligase